MYKGVSKLYYERQKLVDKYANKLLKVLNNILPKLPNEAEFRRHVDRLIDDFRQEAGLPEFNNMVEFTIGSGRADSVLHRVIIEYERPGTLTPDLKDRTTAHAVGQAEQYIKELSEKLAFSGRYMSAIITDGYYIIFARWREGRFYVDPPIKLHFQSARQLFSVLDGLSVSLPLTVDNLYADFNLENPRARRIIRNLYDGFKENLDNDKKIVELLFKQWRLYFSEAIDADKIFSENFSSIRDWARSAGIELKNSRDAEHFIFIMNTYFSLLAKFLAYASLVRHMYSIFGAPMFERLATLDSDLLYEEMLRIESGEHYRRLGINNLLEGELMIWYIKGWNKHVESAIRDMVQRLSEYDPGTLSIIPEETRDLFKGLYHRIIPREVRHALGEYYTPDWLAQHTLLCADEEFFISDDYARLRDKLLTKRWLDPACGSGTFLIMVIKRMKEIGRQLNIDDGTLLDIITHNVVGFDINPLAVLVSRVNYILAIQDLLHARKHEVNIPVYLTDSILMCAVKEGIVSNTHGDIRVYNMPLVLKTFELPEVICKDRRFDEFTLILEGCIDNEYPTESFLGRVKKGLGLGEDEFNPVVEALLQDLYDVMLRYHKRNMNGIWARLLKNNFAPIAEEQFDYIMGNPPWVAWKNLPSMYRDSEKAFRDIWDYYGLLEFDGKINVSIGSKQADLSFLMTYAVADAMLKNGGKLAFVIPQSAFRAHGGYGFRQFKIRKGNGYIPLKIEGVDDLTSMQPFEDASTFTCVFSMVKGESTEYPVRYFVWHRDGAIDYNLSLEEIKSRCTIGECTAIPSDVEDEQSRWVITSDDGQAISKLLKSSYYDAHKGAMTLANAVYWVDILETRPDGALIISNSTKGSKIEVDQVTVDIEAEFIYPLIRGKDIGYYGVKVDKHIVFPYDDSGVVPLSKMQIDYPKTYRYFKKFEEILLKRPDVITGLCKKGFPFYVCYSAKDIMSEWKVAMSRVGSVRAAAISKLNGKVFILDSGVTYVSCSDENEAYYLAGMINSSIFQALVNSKINKEVNVGYPRILKEYYIPTFNPSNELHLKMAELSKKAHEAAAVNDKETLLSVQKEVDETARQIWGLTEEEAVGIIATSRINLAEQLEKELSGEDGEAQEDMVEDADENADKSEVQVVEEPKKPRRKRGNSSSKPKRSKLDTLMGFYDAISKLNDSDK